MILIENGEVYMVDEGVVRRLDELGRVVIPKEMRKLLNVEKKDLVRIIKQNNSIIIKKYSMSCMICGETKNIKEYKGICLCSRCIEQIRKSQSKTIQE